MKHILLIAAALSAIGLGVAAGQQVSPPIANCAMVGAYNLAAQTCADGKFCYVQVDINGQLRTAP